MGGPQGPSPISIVFCRLGLQVGWLTDAQVSKLGKLLGKLLQKDSVDTEDREERYFERGKET